ncbi:hypothetical protein TELCIR_05489 [Teladorsagia circumcincta]|uniref:Uncharacterized protein n=1 Tax=Teladorsagia circumcincta TaxID=45464 RepID=A0A2G9UQN0_TELCI|nr:hypothetical protein TELCIR_05489 [Teladorsagia circumcincta]
MSGPYGQPGYNPQYQNPYPAGGPPPAGWTQGQQQQGFVPPPMPHPTMMGMGGNPHYAEGGEPDKYNLQFSMMGIMFILSMCLMVFGLVAIISAIFFKVKFIYMVYAALASLLFMFYLAIDVQLLMGGRKYEISPEDHIFAAVQIFLDIVYIFWMLLSLFGSSK